MKREWKVQQGKQDRISSDKLNGLACPCVASYTKIHIDFNVLISGKITISNNSFVPEVLDVATLTVVGIIYESLNCD
jgi:hypothetical protein